MNPANHGVPERLDIAGYLESSLAVLLEEHEETYAGPEGAAEAQLHGALDAVGRFAHRVVTRLEIPQEAADDLADFMPGADTREKVAKLLSYNFAQDRLCFDVARDVVWALDGLDKRVPLAVTALTLLLRSQPSLTATKYLERALKLFLAGYAAETIVMCGAVLEAALATRVSNTALREGGYKPAFRRADDFSVGQRMAYARERFILTTDQQEGFWQVVNWRNDAVHVQPDVVPSDPTHALFLTAWLLAGLLPRDAA